MFGCDCSNSETSLSNVVFAESICACQTVIVTFSPEAAADDTAGAADEPLAGAAALPASLAGAGVEPPDELDELDEPPPQAASARAATAVARIGSCFTVGLRVRTGARWSGRGCAA